MGTPPPLLPMSLPMPLVPAVPVVVAVVALLPLHRTTTSNSSRRL